MLADVTAPAGVRSMLNQALGASGRAGELEERRPIETRLPEPPNPPEPGRTAVIVPEE